MVGSQWQLRQNVGWAACIRYQWNMAASVFASLAEFFAVENPLSLKHPEDTSMSAMQQLFAEWPAAIDRKGTVITSWGDSVPFIDYMLNGELLLLIRSQPDAHGTRRLIMELKDVQGIRLTEALDPLKFQAMGFQQIG